MVVNSRITSLRASSLSLRSDRSRFWWFNDRNDSIDDAINIGKLKKSFKYDDDGQVSDDQPDFYRFKVKNSGSVKFSFRNAGEESITFSIVNKRGQLLSVDGRRLFQEVDEDDKEKLNARLSKGTYFLRVTTDGNDEDYSFKLKFRSNSDDNGDDED